MVFPLETFNQSFLRIRIRVSHCISPHEAKDLLGGGGPIVRREGGDRVKDAEVSGIGCHSLLERVFPGSDAGLDVTGSSLHYILLPSILSLVLSVFHNSLSLPFPLSFIFPLQQFQKIQSRTP